MNRLLALIKSSITTLLVLVLIILTTRNMELPKAHDQHLAAMTYNKPILLTNDNMVDVLTEHVDTRNLHAIHLKHDRLEVELLLNTDLTAEEQLYPVVPLYVALAFQYSSNVEKLIIKVLREGNQASEHIQLLQLAIHRDDAWLAQGVQQLKEQPWLELPYWVNALRIEKTVFWQTQYEI